MSIKKIALLAISVLIGLTLLISGCGQQAQREIKLGATAGPHAEVAEAVAQDGAKVAIPNDPTNGGRALMLLAKAGLITLPENTFKVTIQDIQSNPKHLQFIELEAAQLPRSLNDVDLAVITMNYVMSGGLDVDKQGIFLEDKTEPLAVMVLAARTKDKNNEDYRKIAQIFHSEAVKEFIKEQYKGTIVPAE